ncbi:hypothetical protein ACIBI4_32560 [Streptomyces sp. NPDC050418]|uniref:hypothetical protein n=1 Tax=Streptomyces sp. NPDC050418 TaxID=3365612 RepID=UPI0037889809
MSVSTGHQGGQVTPDDGTHPGAGRRGVSAWVSLRRTLFLILFALAGAAGNTALASVTLQQQWIPISAGLVVCFAFLIMLALLHRAWWLTVLSLLPSLFVLVGSVQLGPEVALEARGVRESVVVVADSAAGTGSNDHRLTLRTEDGQTLDEKFVYSGSSGYPEVGERLDILRDPDGKVPMEQADQVDASGERGTLIGGVATWVVFVLLAGWRGHVRRRNGKELKDLPTF